MDLDTLTGNPIVAALRAKERECLAEGDHAGAGQCRALIAHELAPGDPLEAARLAAAHNARKPTAREVGRYVRVVSASTRPRLIRRARQSCGSCRRPGARRAASRSAGGGSSGDPDEPEPALGRSQSVRYTFGLLSAAERGAKVQR